MLIPQSTLPSTRSTDDLARPYCSMLIDARVPGHSAKILRFRALPRTYRCGSQSWRIGRITMDGKITVYNYRGI
jgi:hypothetical protein